MFVFWQRTFVLLFLHFLLCIFYQPFYLHVYWYGPSDKITSENELYSHGQFLNLTHNVFTIFWCKEVISKDISCDSFCQ
jgi:hypothetical protein